MWSDGRPSADRRIRWVLQMGMFDWYEPSPLLSCSACGRTLEGWQGKQGPCGLFVWRQGTRSPIDQRVEGDLALDPEDRKSLALPDRFMIYTDCECSETTFDAICICEAGVWTSTRLAGPDDVDVIYKDRPKSDRSASRRRLRGDDA